MNSIRWLVSWATVGAVVVSSAVTGFAAEKIDRGMIALRTSESTVYLGWRLLASDPAGRVFNVYRSTNGGEAVKLNDAPGTWFRSFFENSSTSCALVLPPCHVSYAFSATNTSLRFGP